MTEYLDIGDAKDWARRLMRAHTSGAKVPIACLTMAKAALGIDQPLPNAGKVMARAQQREKVAA